MWSDDFNLGNGFISNSVNHVSGEKYLLIIV